MSTPLMVRLRVHGKERAFHLVEDSRYGSPLLILCLFGVSVCTQLLLRFCDLAVLGGPFAKLRNRGVRCRDEILVICLLLEIRKVVHRSDLKHQLKSHSLVRGLTTCELHDEIRRNLSLQATERQPREQFWIDGTSSNSSCTISAGVVGFTGVGTCVVDADQAGNADYLAAPQVQQSFTVAQGSKTISFTSSAPSSATYSGSNNHSYVVSATASSGLSVTLSIDPSSTSGCTISDSAVSYGGGVGTCIIDANQAGNADYLAAPQVQQSFTVA